MFESLKRKIGLWKAGRAERKNKRKLLQSSAFWSGMETIIIAVPEGFHAVDELKKFLKGLKLPKSYSLYFWTTASHLELLRYEFPGSKVVTPSDFIYNRWFLPEKVQVLEHFDPKTNLVIDLSMDFQLDSVYLWSCFPDAYRVGMYHFDQDQFFDVILPVKPETGFPQRLVHIQTVLNSLN